VNETGSGTLNGGEVKLQGGATGPGYGYAATYGGRVDGDRAILTGVQVWTTSRSSSQSYNRACQISLTR